MQMQVVNETYARNDERRLSSVSTEFAGQIATAVWLGKLGSHAACEALWCYAAACRPGSRRDATQLWRTLIDEYRRRREWQDACG